jgi:2-polyprenyl-3-methyl-5-hydroxy-6-metoxy-1,4-benzoquinol methylase
MTFLKKDLVKQGIIYRKPLNDDSVEKVADFYKQNPFPNYKNDDNKNSISKKGNKNYLSSNFKNFIGYNKKILEVGCGTGQLALYFSIGTNNLVVGLDATIESLELASDFAKKNEINNINFVNADIFDDVLKDDCFDFIWCNGVLHHTKNPSYAFKILTKSLKKQGYILVGLYNRIGRIRTIIRKYIYKLFGIKVLIFFDPTLKNLKLNEEEKKSWLRDQYHHPIESLHTIDEVLKWFSKNNIEFINSIPHCAFEANSEKNLFTKQSKGSLFSRLLNQFNMIYNNLGSDGGLFVVIGRKN